MLLPCPLQLHIDCDGTASLTHPSAAVDQNRLLVAVGVRVTNPPQEVEQGGEVTGDTKVWPRGEVELTHLPHLLRVHLTWRRERDAMDCKIKGILNSTLYRRVNSSMTSWSQQPLA